MWSRTFLLLHDNVYLHTANTTITFLQNTLDAYKQEPTTAGLQSLVQEVGTEHRMNIFGKNCDYYIVRIPMLQNCSGYVYVNNTSISFLI
jgi:hypothetical protein